MRTTLAVCTSPAECISFQKMSEVDDVYLRLCEQKPNPSVAETARLSRVGWDYVKLMITELKESGVIKDPEMKRRKKLTVLGPGQKLSTVHEMFLLSLRTLNPARPMYSYVQEVDTHFGKGVSYRCI
jgi:hypothetical protein